MNSIELNIHGMHCAGCVSTVEKSLAKVTGVDTAVVNLSLEKAVVTGSMDKKQLIEAVKSSGYTATQFIQEDLNRDINLEKLAEAKKRMVLGWLVTIPIMAWMLVEMITGLVYPSPEVYHTMMLLLSAVAVFFAGGDTIRNGWKSIVYFSPNMDP